MNVIASTDLWFPGQQDPVGLPQAGSYGGFPSDADRTRYIVWVDAGRGGGERKIRMGLHLVACRNGTAP